MKKITVIGMGTGRETLTREAARAIAAADALIGSRRLIEPYKNRPKRLFENCLPNEIIDVIERETAECFAVLVSGDVGFYSAAAGLSSLPPCYDVSFIPGVSIVNAFFSRLKLPWYNAFFISAHEREADIVGCVRRNRLTFCVTGNNAREIAGRLTAFGFGEIKAYVGENIGLADERIYETAARDLAQNAFPPLTALLFINEDFNDKTPVGLPDDSFIRLPGVPVTKSETRAVIMSKLDIKPGDICYDIGAGTGSVTVEMAYGAYKGRVYAIERGARAAALIENNCRAHHLGNVTVINGAAPKALAELPAPGAVFIGGSGGYIRDIIKTVLDKNKNAVIVIAAITVETVYSAQTALRDMGRETEVTQINAARGKLIGAHNILEAQNPVTIIKSRASSPLTSRAFVV